MMTASVLAEMGLTVPDERPTNGVMSAGEVTRTLQRIERGVERIEQQMIPEVLNQVAAVRHRVSNLEQTTLFKENFMKDYNGLKEQIQQKADLQDVEELERKTVAAEAVAAYKKYLLGAIVLGGGGFALAIFNSLFRL